MTVYSVGQDRERSVRIHTIAILLGVLVPLACASCQSDIQRPGCPERKILEVRTITTRSAIESVVQSCKAQPPDADPSERARYRQEYVCPAVERALRLLNEGEARDRPIPVTARVLRHGVDESLWPNDTLVVIVLDLCFRSNGFILEDPVTGYRGHFEVFHQWPGQQYIGSTMLDQRVELLYEGAEQTPSTQAARAEAAPIEVPAKVFLEGSPTLRLTTADGWVGEPIDVWVWSSGLRLYDPETDATQGEVPSTRHQVTPRPAASAPVGP